MELIGKSYRIPPQPVLNAFATAGVKALLAVGLMLPSNFCVFTVTILVVS